ncbi:MAG: glycosyltransferase family protein, partial [Pseudoclavibacter sp.]
SLSVWPLAHGVRIRLDTGDVDGAMDYAERLVAQHGGSPVAEQALKDLGNGLWAKALPRQQLLAARNDRNLLVEEVKANVDRQVAIRQNWIARGDDTAPKATIRRDKVLIVADLGLPQTKRYRVDQKREQLEAAGYLVTVTNWQELSEARAVLAWHDVIIVYRAPAWPKIVRFITDARAAGKVVFYEIDDMLYTERYPPPIESYGGQISIAEYDGLMMGMAAYRAAAQLCDYALTSTAPLVDSLSTLVRTGRGFLHRNGFDALTPTSTPAMPREPYAPLHIFYGSGTKAHNDDFVGLVLPALDRLMRENERVRLVTVGYLTLPTAFVERHGDRLRQLPFTKSVEAYMSLLRAADINLAVLHPDELTDGKSELKWFEAANFGIPSVMSDTANYVDVIRDGDDGFLARSTDDWYRHLGALLDDDELRARIGETARARVTREYGVAALSANIDAIIQAACDDLESRMGARR